MKHPNEANLPMKMIILFLPEKYLEMLDTLVASNLYQNRSEALRMATWKFLHESVSLLKVAATATTTSKTKDKTSATAKKEAAPEPEPEQDEEVDNEESSELDDALNEIDAGRHPVTTVTPDTSTSPDADPFDEIVREQQHA